MKSIVVGLAFVAVALAAAPAAAQIDCQQGTYRAPDGNFVVLVPSRAASTPGMRYLFRDGRRGSASEAGAPLTCDAETVTVDRKVWPRIAFRETPVTFDSLQTKLSGMLIEPPGADPHRPLVVMVHGSERTSPIGGVYGYAMAAQGLSVFVYDKRGTGASEGDYTQNFELLAEDAAKALDTARRTAAGRFGRSGFFGGSQGGWVAPRAATLTKADFVAIGFGLVASPIEEDREQMVSEVRAAGLGPEAEALVNRLSKATAGLLLSNFKDGYNDLDAIRAEMAGKPWAAKIEGEYSGAMARLPDADLRRIGRARFDNLELIWDYDAIAVLKKLDTPLLWVLAGEDREAPIETTRGALMDLNAAGKPVDVYLFPDTDHGMVEFKTNADGSRTSTRITDGYLKLLGDWIKGDLHGPYGRADHLTEKR